mmetsp:Transcript_58303/g.107372  ORF Transcript_58303/g.107372 Transcript_58303/m.107372 type:complete len:494 (-) Transcript_58303:230-1711(-)
MVNICDAMFTACCVAPVVILISCYVTGCQEKQAVCIDRANDAALDNANKISGNNPSEHDGDLIIFTGELQKSSIKRLNVQLGAYFTLPKDFVSPGLRISSEMMQCIETEHYDNFNDTTSDPHGVSLWIRYWTYDVKYDTTYHDSALFKGKSQPPLSPHQKQFVSAVCNQELYLSVCQGQPNAPWDASLPKTGTVWSSSAKVNSFNIANKITQLELKPGVPSAVLTGSGKLKKFNELERSTFERSATTNPAPAPAPSGGRFSKWTRGRGGASQDQSPPTSVSTGIGDSRVVFESFDWSDPTFTLFGENDHGEIDDWEAPAAWLCTGTTINAEFKPGLVKLKTIIENNKNVNKMMLYLVRFLGFMFLWYAFRSCAKPWEATAECIPCCGQCISNIIADIACVVGCCLSVALMFTIIAIVWMIMNPLISIPMLLIACFIWGYIGYYIYNKVQGTDSQAIQDKIQGKFGELKKAVGAREKVGVALQEPLKFSVVSVV